MFMGLVPSDPARRPVWRGSAPRFRLAASHHVVRHQKAGCTEDKGCEPEETKIMPSSAMAISITATTREIVFGS
jgi:hypothetical protein